mgnify:CR=1 FL=1
MNVRGERIIVFGDSLSAHPGSAEIWDVNAGSNRSSSAPGDLVASLLAEQGAQAVRVNARVSRSAWNFWGRENTAALLASDRAFAPTKVVVILGTNDVGLNAKLDSESFAKLRDAYKAMGAEVWAVGPFANTALPPAGVEQVVATMHDVFGSRFIDGRPISVLIHPGGDGVHYPAASARALALAITDAVITKFSPSTIWMTLGLSAAGVVGAVLVGMVWKRRKQGLLGDASLGLATRDEVQELIEAGELDVAQDAMLERGDKLSQIAKVSGEISPHTFANYKLDLGQGRWLRWRVKQAGVGRCTVGFQPWAGGAAVYDPDSEPTSSSYQYETGYYGGPDYCARAAAADAWAMAKVLVADPLGLIAVSSHESIANRNKVLGKRLKEALDVDNSEPAELYGLGAHSSNRAELYGVNIVDGKRSNKDHNALVRSGARQVACKSGLDRQATCWTLAGVGAALGDAKQMLSAFETQLVGTPAGKALLKTLTPEQIADVRKVVTQAARNAEQLEAFEAEEAGELDGLGRKPTSKDVTRAIIDNAPIGGLGAFKVSTKDPRTLTASQLNKELDKLDVEDSKITEKLIAAGRGHETYSETSKMTDPLSLEWNAIQDRMQWLRAERDIRFGPNSPPRLPTHKRGWYGPRKKPDDLDGLGAYRVWYGTTAPAGSPQRTIAIDDGRSIPTIEQATKLMRSYKRRGFWTWVEDEQGNFVPVPGAKSEKIRKSYPKPLPT